MHPLDDRAITWIRRVRFVAGGVVVAWSVYLGIVVVLGAIDVAVRTRLIEYGDVVYAIAHGARDVPGYAFCAGPLALVALVVVAQRARTAMGEPWLPSSPLVVVGCLFFPVIAPAWMLHKLEKRLLLHVRHPAPMEAAALVWLPIALLVVVALTSWQTWAFDLWLLVLAGSRALVCVRLRRACTEIVDANVSARGVFAP